MFVGHGEQHRQRRNALLPDSQPLFGLAQFLDILSITKVKLVLEAQVPPTTASWGTLLVADGGSDVALIELSSTSSVLGC